MPAEELGAGGRSETMEEEVAVATRRGPSLRGMCGVCLECRALGPHRARAQRPLPCHCSPSCRDLRGHAWSQGELHGALGGMEGGARRAP